MVIQLEDYRRHRSSQARSSSVRFAAAQVRSVLQALAVVPGDENGCTEAFELGLLYAEASLI